jgi:uncharacterized membrane protein
MKNQLLKIILILIFTIGITFAHEDHKKDKPDTVTVVNGDTIAINGIPVDSLSLVEEFSSELVEEEDATFVLHNSDQVFEHLHNKIVHFPIAFIVAGFFFTLLGFKDEKFSTTIRILVVLAAIFGVTAFFTGNAQAEVFIGEPKEWLANVHRILGLITIIGTIIWVLFLFLGSLKRYAWVIALVTFILVSVVGFYGGVLAH